MVTGEVRQIRKSNLLLAEDFLRALPAASDREAMRQLLGEVAREMGFRHFAMIHHDNLGLHQPLDILRVI